MAEPPETPWQWDPTLFKGSAPYYPRGRLPYAPGLPEAIAEALTLDGSGRFMDVGCGPGTVALELAHLFDEVVALDPDLSMLQEGRRLAASRGISNLRWVELRAEDLPAELGTFQLVGFAQSLHWMDQPRVFGTIRSMLEAGAAVVHIDTTSPGTDVTSLPFPTPPDARVSELRRAYLGADRRAGLGIRNTSPDGEDEVFRAVGFSGPQQVRVPDGQILERDVDDLVADAFSRSSMAPHLFGENQSAFENDLRRLLLEASPTGRFSVRNDDTLLKIWRPG